MSFFYFVYTHWFPGQSVCLPTDKYSHENKVFFYTHNY